MKPNINIRSIGWGIKYGIWVGTKREQNRIIKQLQEYVEDVKICHKDDSCKDIAFVIEEQIKEIRGDYK